ncbi:MAG: DUF4159 domain-containing protein [Vicinamibacterales bacterium]
MQVPQPSRGERSGLGVGTSRGRYARTLALVMLLLVALASAAAAQRRFFYGWDETVKNVPYDGRYTFARVRYTPAPGGTWAGGRPSWVHGYPLAEQNLMRIMKEVSLLDAHIDDMNVVTLEDPEMFKYPILYIIEVGWWTLSDTGMKNLRAYLQKGGFLIVDDFKVAGWRGLPGGGWQPFEDNVRRVLPGAVFFDMSPSDPIFHCFFEITTLDNFPQAYTSGRAVFRGVYEDNDPKKRLLMIVNYNTDVSQYWEWSGRGLRPFDDTNEAYKLAVNYLIYGLSH